MASQFIKEANKILQEYDCKPSTYLGYKMQRQTQYGLVYIHVDTDTMRNKLFSIFMRFDTNGFKKEEFMRAFLTDNFNPYSYKWNIHTSDINSALQTLENRLEGLTYPLSI